MPAPVVGHLERPMKRLFSDTVVMKTTAGPASYTTGGFDVVIGELSRIKNAIVQCDKGYLAYIDWNNSKGNKLRIVVDQFNYPATAAGPADEVGAGTDLSSVNFTIVAGGD